MHGVLVDRVSPNTVRLQASRRRGQHALTASGRESYILRFDSNELVASWSRKFRLARASSHATSDILRDQLALERGKELREVLHFPSLRLPKASHASQGESGSKCGVEEKSKGQPSIERDTLLEEQERVSTR